MPRIAFAATFILVSLTALPLYAQSVPAGATPSPNKEIAPATTPPSTPADIQPGSKPEGVPAAATQGSPPASEARIGKMRDRWRKMTPEQREDMRKKASRRLQERYERLSPQEQTQLNNIESEIAKLSREQRSVLMARVHKKSYDERQQRKAMKEQEAKGAAAGSPPPVATPGAPAPAAAPESKPASP